MGLCDTVTASSCFMDLKKNNGYQDQIPKIENAIFRLGSRIFTLAVVADVDPPLVRSAFFDLHAHIVPSPNPPCSFFSNPRPIH
jgi:hypothetical protein